MHAPWACQHGRTSSLAWFQVLYWVRGGMVGQCCTMMDLRSRRCLLPASSVVGLGHRRCLRGPLQGTDGRWRTESPKTTLLAPFTAAGPCGAPVATRPCAASAATRPCAAAAATRPCAASAAPWPCAASIAARLCAAPVAYMAASAGTATSASDASVAGVAGGLATAARAAGARDASAASARADPHGATTATSAPTRCGPD
jgi:hypothetical protein